MNKYSKTLIGMEIEKYVGEVCEGANCDFTYYNQELKRYRLIFKGGETLVLWETYGECYSGWTTASWGCWKHTLERKPFSYIPKTGSTEVAIEEQEDIYIIVKLTSSNTVIAQVDTIGDDEWYPSGGVFVEEDFFTPTTRTMQERPVWIFVGSSGLGKSSLAADVDDKKVFETDSVDKLPSRIWADIVVVGNKQNFSLKAIKRRLPDGTKPIIVRFSEQ